MSSSPSPPQGGSDETQSPSKKGSKLKKVWKRLTSKKKGDDHDEEESAEQTQNVPNTSLRRQFDPQQQQPNQPGYGNSTTTTSRSLSREGDQGIIQHLKTGSGPFDNNNMDMHDSTEDLSTSGESEQLDFHKRELYSYYGIDVTPPASPSSGSESSNSSGVDSNEEPVVRVIKYKQGKRRLSNIKTAFGVQITESDQSPPPSPAAAHIHPRSAPRITRPIVSKPRPPQKGPSLESILKDPEEFPQFIKFVGEDKHQDVLFICEVEQFLERCQLMKKEDILQQMQKIVHIYLSDDAPACVECLSKKHANRIKECVKKGEFDITVFRKAKEDVESSIRKSQLKKYWDLKNRQKGATMDLIADDENDLELHHVVEEYDVERSLLLFLTRDRRHRLLLFWLHMVHSGVPDLNPDRFIKTDKEVQSLISKEEEAKHKDDGEEDKDNATKEKLVPGKKKVIKNIPDVPDKITDELLQKALTGCSNRMHLLHTLQDIYHKFVSFGIHTPVVDADLDRMFLKQQGYTLSRRKVVALSLQLNQEIYNLLCKLKPMYKKVDKILRLQCWPQFCKSEEYKTLVARRKEMKRLQQHHPQGGMIGHLGTPMIGSNRSSGQPSPATTPVSLSPRSTNATDGSGSAFAANASGNDDTQSLKISTLSTDNSSNPQQLSPRRSPSAQKDGGKTRIRNFTSFVKTHPGTQDMVIASCPPESHRQGSCPIYTGSERLIEGVVVLKSRVYTDEERRKQDYNNNHQPKSTTTNKQEWNEPHSTIVFSSYDMSSSSSQAKDDKAAGKPEYDSIYQADLCNNVIPHLGSFCFSSQKWNMNRIVAEREKTKTQAHAPWVQQLTSLMDIEADLSPSASCYGQSETTATDYGDQSDGEDPDDLCLEADKIFPFVLSSINNSGFVYVAALCVNVREHVNGAAAATENDDGDDNDDDDDATTTSSSLDDLHTYSYAICLVSSRPITEFLQEGLGKLHHTWKQIRDQRLSKALTSGTEEDGNMQPIVPVCESIMKLLRSNTFGVLVNLTEKLDPATQSILAMKYFNACPSELELIRGEKKGISTEKERDRNNPLARKYHGVRDFSTPWDGWVNDCKFNPRNPHLGPGTVAYQHAFQALHPSRFLAILRALLFEKKILLVSSQVTLLYEVSQCVLSLMYPFEWPYPMIPFLPLDMFEYLHCPTPFLIGIERRYLSRAKEIDDALNNNVVCIDLDLDTITYPNNDPTFVPSFPPVWEREILHSIRTLFYTDFAFIDEAATYSSSSTPLFQQTQQEPAKSSHHKYSENGDNENKDEDVNDASTNNNKSSDTNTNPRLSKIRPRLMTDIASPRRQILAESISSPRRKIAIGTASPRRFVGISSPRRARKFSNAGMASPRTPTRRPPGGRKYSIGSPSPSVSRKRFSQGSISSPRPPPKSFTRGDRQEDNEEGDDDQDNNDSFSDIYNQFDYEYDDGYWSETSFYTTSPCMLPDTQLRLLFFKMWVDLLQGYRQFCSLLHDDKDPLVLFDVPSFINVKSPTYEPFLREFFRTQCFQVFLNQRIDGIFGVRPVEGVVLPLSHRFGRELDLLRKSLEDANLVVDPSAAGTERKVKPVKKPLSEDDFFENQEETDRASGNNEAAGAEEEKDSSSNTVYESTVQKNSLRLSSSMSCITAERMRVRVPYIYSIFDVSEYVCAALEMTASSDDHPLLHVAGRGMDISLFWHRACPLTVAAVQETIRMSKRQNQK